MWLSTMPAQRAGVFRFRVETWTTAQLSHLPSQKLHNRTVLGFATRSGKTSSPPVSLDFGDTEQSRHCNGQWVEIVGDDVLDDGFVANRSRADLFTTQSPGGERIPIRGV